MIRTIHNYFTGVWNNQQTVWAAPVRGASVTSGCRYNKRLNSLGEAPEAAGWCGTAQQRPRRARTSGERLSLKRRVSFFQHKMALTQEAILCFLLERGGKARNSELLNSFRAQINCGDPAEKQHNRELFKKLVNSVAVVKQRDEVKFVVVKKRYQDFVKDSQKTPMDGSFSGPNASFTCTSPLRAEAGMMRSDVGNNNVCYASVSAEDATTVKVLNISADRTSKSGPVFAVIAVKSPPRDSVPATQNGLSSHVNLHKNTDKPEAARTEVSAPPAPSLNLTFPARMRDELISGTLPGETRQTEGRPALGFPQARPPNKPTRQADDSKYSEPVPLEPLAHEWLVKCAAGLWGHIYALLLQDTGLAQRKDFMSGFTALHWAAKNGNSDMMHKLMDISKNRGACINVNSKAHGGYTPLHIAAIHGHTDVMVSLVRLYGADVQVRDNDGKKAFHYLGSGASAETRALLGGRQQSRRREKTEDGEYRDAPKGFTSISKLFQPHTGRKQKAPAKFAQDW